MGKARVVLVLVACCVLAAVRADAQATRTWVSGVGDDVNPCSRTAPCKTFAGAISKTAAGGEISVLDPGPYGAVTITKTITIDGAGTLASILASNVNGVVINAGTADRVVLRNLMINGVGTGLNGIRFLAGKHLHVENVVIQGFTQSGIDVALTAGTLSNVHVQDTTITAGSASVATTNKGVRLSSTSGLLLATLDNVSLAGLRNGLEVAANSRATVTGSVISGNLANGILASVGSAVINVERCQIVFNELTGVNASVSGSTIRLANNEIYNNTTGISIAAGATVSSAGNNRVFGNGSSTAPNGPAITLQ